MTMARFYGSAYKNRTTFREKKYKKLIEELENFRLCRYQHQAEVEISGPRMRIFFKKKWPNILQLAVKKKIDIPSSLG
jgi:hypothetical protein